MSLSSTNITSRLQNITLCFSIIILCLLSITFLTGNIFGISLSSNNTNNASALTYSSTTDVSFTFSPKLSISLSDTNLVIDTLVPGQTSTSNAITITVASNTPYGYSLYADAGSNNTSSPYYNTSNLIHEDNTINNTFTSIATNASLTSLTTDNTWGYSTSNDNGTTWSTYNGLPTATNTSSSTSTSNPALLIDAKDPADSSRSIAFKVAARASTTQASGTYGNVINFYAVGKPAPVYMQDTETIKSRLKNVGDELQVIDIRDGGEYTIAKLKDGNIWMTQNLDLPGSTPLYSDTSDVPNGYSSAEGTPYYTLPASSELGFDSDRGAYVYNTPYDEKDRNHCANNHPCYSYYSWWAANAKNESGAFSICPKGWKLPSSRQTVSMNSDFYQLAVSYGMDSDKVSQGTSEFYEKAGPGTVPNFSISGYFSSYFRFDDKGRYWSSVSDRSINGYYFYFDASMVVTSSSSSKANGYPVRCLMR